MGLILKVSLFSTLVLLVHAQQRQDGNAIDLVAFTRLLRTAARVAYPVTNRVNNVVGNLRDIEAIPFLLNIRPNANPNTVGRNRKRPNFQNIRRTNLPARNNQDTGRRYPHRPTYYNYDDEYDYDLYEDYVEPVNIYEADEDFEVLPELEPKHANGVILLSDLLDEDPNHKPIPSKIGKPRPALVSKDGRVQSKILQQQPGLNVPLTNSNAPGNVLPGANDAQPKIIYVVVNPSEVTPDMIKDNSVVLNHDLASSAVNPHTNVNQAAVKPIV